MADIENKYYQVDDDSVDSQPVTSGRWFKLGAALSAGVGLALVYIMAQSASVTNSVESTNLVALSRAMSPQLRPSSAMGCIPNLPDCGPYQKLAVSAFQAMNQGKSVRDVAVQAGMDKQTKAVMAAVDKVVVKSAAAKEMPGVTAPLGFFDPMGISTDIPEGRLLFFREAELKHGRVAMLATLGIVVGEKFHPFFGAPAIPSTMMWQETSHKWFWINLAVLAFFLESVTLKNWEDGSQMKAGYVPGDLEFDPLGLKPKKEQDFKEMQTKELNNGRLAMFATLGMLATELVTGKQLEGATPWYPR